MKKQSIPPIIVFFCILLLAGARKSRGETFYVRSGEACIHNGDGTDYRCASEKGQIGAWAGFSNISWGSGEGHIGPGDTLYVCGTHDAVLTVQANGSYGKPIVIRGDYPGNPGVIRCPTTSLDGAWERFPETNVYYRTLSNVDWVGQVFLNTLSHETAMACDHARIRVGPSQWGDFRTYRNTGNVKFKGYSVFRGNGTVEVDRKIWLASNSEDPRWQVSCRLTKGSGDDTYITKRARLAGNTTYILSYGGRSGGDGESFIGIACKTRARTYYLQNNANKGIYNTWTTARAKIGSESNPDVTIIKSDTSWTRKEMVFKTHADFEGDYYFFFGPTIDNTAGNEYINIDDITIYTVSHLSQNSFTALSALQGDQNNRSTDVKLYVHMPDGEPPGSHEVLYQDRRQAIDLDNRTYVEIRNLEVWGSIAGDITTHGDIHVTVDTCSVHYGGGAMQGPNGKLGDKSSRSTGALAFVADRHHAYHRVQVTDCTIEKALGVGVRLRHCQSGEMKDNTIRNFGCGNAPCSAAFYGTRVHNFLVERNLCDTAGYHGSHSKQRKEGINGIWFDTNSDSDVVRYNWVENVTGGYYSCESSDNGKWYYNIGTAGAKYGMQIGGGQEAHGNKIYNNTLIGIRSITDSTGDTNQGVGILLYDQDEGQTLIKNNIIHCENGYYVYVHPNFAGSALTIDYNLYYGLSGNRWHWKGMDYSTLSGWKKAGTNRNDINGPGETNPLFVDTAKHNLRLLPVSPCIDAGDNVGLSRDFAGHFVPYNSRPDIGSYEYNPAEEANHPKQVKSQTD